MLSQGRCNQMLRTFGWAMPGMIPFFFSSLKFWPKFLEKNLFCSTGIALPVSTHRPELLNLVTTVALLQYEF